MNPYDAAAQPRPPQITSVDAQRVEDALSLLAPKWTTWAVQTLAAQREPMRVRDVAARLPFVSEQLVGKRLAQMHAGGLVARTDDRFGSPYRLSGFGAALTPVHQALADWSKEHLSLGSMAGAERVEDAVRRLHLRHTSAVIQTLGDGPRRFVHISESTGLDDPYTWQRLVRLQIDGLVTRTGPRHGDPYTLTDAGAALGPVYAAVENWSSHFPTPQIATAAAVTTATRTHDTDPPRADGIRTAAALRRSPVAPSGLFSHAPGPQPPVPAIITAQSSPCRGK